MSTTLTRTCDGCGVVETAGPDREWTRPWWDFMYSSHDFPVDRGGERFYEFKSGSWDFCGDCAVKARDALIAIGGKPDHDGWPSIARTTVAGSEPIT